MKLQEEVKQLGLKLLDAQACNAELVRSNGRMREDLQRIKKSFKEEFPNLDELKENSYKSFEYLNDLVEKMRNGKIRVLHAGAEALVEEVNNDKVWRYFKTTGKFRAIVEYELIKDGDE